MAFTQSYRWLWHSGIMDRSCTTLYNKYGIFVNNGRADRETNLFLSLNVTKDIEKQKWNLRRRFNNHSVNSWSFVSLNVILTRGFSATARFSIGMRFPLSIVLNNKNKEILNLFSNDVARRAKRALFVKACEAKYLYTHSRLPRLTVRVFSVNSRWNKKHILV